MVFHLWKLCSRYVGFEDDSLYKISRGCMMLVVHLNRMWPKNFNLVRRMENMNLLLQTYSEATWPFLHRVLVDRGGRWVVPARTNSQPQRENETRRPFAGYLKTNVQLIHINQYILIFLKQYNRIMKIDHIFDFFNMIFNMQYYDPC